MKHRIRSTVITCPTLSWISVGLTFGRLESCMGMTVQPR